MKKMCFLFFLFLLLSGCRVIPENEGKSLTPARRENDSSAIRDSGEKLLSSIQKNEYSVFLQTLGEEFAGKITEKDFRTSRRSMEKQFGKLQSFRYLARQKIPFFQHDLWLVSFEKKNRDGSIAETELLFRLVSARDQGKTHIMGFGFL